MTSEAIDAAKIEAEQIKSFRDFLFSYNKLSELCFVDCVWDFTSRTIKDQENSCAVNCAEKFLKANQRISQCFQEFQVLSNENALAMAKK
ncbi:mitochondrial import inner membrane translocase subunit Tim9-like [Daphnia pulex]|uniref:mitochondrial import inner membrane translocase subunit Tim9-like n=1 Tax=Daphnia pulex TaxID=6669 RepID=UPI001EDF7F95|nr:mitochondrial import inner membrane translocase subunit Tim9-like [Daphnia pulex]